MRRIDNVTRSQKMMTDLKHRTLRAGIAKSGAQAANFLLRMVCLVVLARLLEPTDFGLVGMVTAITGFLSLFREFGLSLAAVQRSEITEEQTSTLFWINIAIGVVLCLSSIAIAPFVASFYHEPRLGSIMVVLGLGFVFNAAGVQHSALLQRQMRFSELALVDVVSLTVSSVLSLVLAAMGFGYWSLVAWSVAQPFMSTIQLWLHTRWVPGKPSGSVGTGSLLRFGGIVTVNTLVVHIAYNLDKVLLGRYWGAEVVGLYGRAYQLITLPTDLITGPIGGVAISALSRLQDDRKRMWSYFQKGYSLVLAVTVPLSIVCALFAEEIVLVVLGPKWSDAIPIFQLLAPTQLVFAVINPTGWLLVALGRVERSLKLALVLAPLVVIGCVLGLPYGSNGVALGFSVAMLLWVVPHLFWSFHGTGASFREIASTIGRPLIGAGIAGVVAFAVRFAIGTGLPVSGKLAIGGLVFVAIYLGVLLFVMKQRAVYVEIIHGLRGQQRDKALVAT
jgi:PST family polysaccharide transporter